MKIEIAPGGKASISRMEFDGCDLIRSSGQETRVSEAKHPMTLHCQQCNTVLGDSHGVCGEISCLDSIMCLSKFISRITTASFFSNIDLVQIALPHESVNPATKGVQYVKFMATLSEISTIQLT